MSSRLGPDPTHVTPMFDYTHGKQNLRELLDLVPAKVKASQPALAEACKAGLWQGQIEPRRQAVHLGEQRRKHAYNP